MISRSFERPERTAKRANDTSNRYRMRHIGSQDASASCLVSAHDHILGTHKPLALPYLVDEEQTFVLSANLPKLDRAGRLWVACASLGAGMTDADAVRSVPEDLVELGGGRLAVRVRGRNPRVVPIRAEYTSLAREAAQAAEGAKFVQGDNDNAAALVAAKIAGRPGPAHKVTHLSLRRARNTWLVAHLRANTPWLALRVIAGPVSAYKLNALMAHVAEGFDPDEAVQLGLAA